MPTFQIRIVNSEFADCTDNDVVDAAARSLALKAALQIGADEICRGSSFFAAEAVIEQYGSLLDRLVVAIGTSSLQQPR